MMIHCLGFVSIASTVVAAAPEARIPMEPGVPIFNASTSSWAKVGNPPPEHRMTFVVAVRVDDERQADLERVFWEVSNPDHENYGRYLNLHQVTELLAVPEERAERVRAYFASTGATEAVVSPNRDMITVTMPVAAVEAALDTKIHIFSHPIESASIMRASAGYSLPLSIASDVVMVGELLQFPNPHYRGLQGLIGGSGQWPNACSAAGCKGLVTPAVLAQRYKLPSASASASASASNSMAVSEFQGQYYRDQDLQAFGKSCHRDVKVDKNIGQNVPSAGVESELDIEYIKAVAPEVSLTVIYNAQYSLLNWANALSSMSDPPLIQSVSYGNDERQQSSTQYMDTSNTAFKKAGVRGVSILFASGDQGVCGREGCGIFKFRFKPDFPAGSPYITAVGGTDFEGADIGPECAWQSGGGGFSDTFPIPAYQKEAVAAYKASPDAKLPPQAYWNGTGRGYPDVAALGGTKTPYCVSTGGQFAGVAGTSASCPVVAGIFAKLNGLRLAAGKPAMGFLNPFIYKNPSGFQDVTCGINKASRNYGFSAVKGWDAATGFGTPDFEALSKLAMVAARPKTTESIVI